MLPELNLTRIPSTKEESWKYTDISRAIKKIDLVAIPDLPSMNINTDADFVVTASDGEYKQSRFSISVPAGQTITVIERHAGEGAYWKNTTYEIHVERGATLYHYRLFDEAEAGVSTVFTHVNIHRDAQYKLMSMISGAGMVRHQIHADIWGENAECTLNGVNLLSGSQHADTTITIEHHAPQARSFQTYKNVLAGASRGVFQGKVHVHQAAQKTDGYQLSSTLMLSNLAEMDVKPELEIYADDVKCSHGATTGKLDEQSLFYLRARGIPEDIARGMLVEAFVGELIDGVPPDVIRNEMQGILNKWLESHA